MLSRVERKVCQYFGQMSFSSGLAFGNSILMGRQLLPSLSDFMIGVIIALCHFSGICPVEIDIMKILVR